MEELSHLSIEFLFTQRLWTHPIQTSSAHFKKPAWSVPEDELAGSTFASPCLLGVGELKSWSTEGGSFQLGAHHTTSDFSPPPPDPGETGNTCYLWSNRASMKIPLTDRFKAHTCNPNTEEDYFIAILGYKVNWKISIQTELAVGPQAS